MNRKNNKRKGFTIVELVIVIAVIGILAGVMIPTFGGIIDKANESNRDSMAKNALTNYLADHAAEGMDSIDGHIVIQEAGKTGNYTVTNGQLVDLDSDNTTVTASGTCLYTNVAADDGE